MEEAKRYCPITCEETKEPEFCKMVDCSNHEAHSLCPTTCREKIGNWHIHLPEYLFHILDISLSDINGFFHHNNNYYLQIKDHAEHKAEMMDRAADPF